MSDNKPRVLGKGEYTRMFQKIYGFIKKVFIKTQKDITDLDTKIDTVASYKDDLQSKIDNVNDKVTATKIDVAANANKISDLKAQLDNTNLGDGHPEGSVVNVNNIDQYLFTDVSANEVIEIPNENGKDDFIIECFEQIEGQDDVEVRVFSFTEANKDQFLYDERYLELSSDGIKPKTQITLNYNLVESEKDDTTREGFEIYVSDEIPQELFDNIEQINSIEES